MLRIFFLVFSQLTVGGLALMRFVPAAEIGKGFFRTCAAIYLVIWILVLAGLAFSMAASTAFSSKRANSTSVIPQATAEFITMLP